MKAPSKLSSVILWSVISAAFIGPGTVTTAVSVGAQYQFDLVWAIVFATIACIVLQEISARIVIASGLTLGQILTVKFGERRGFVLQLVIGGSVILGCAAYEAGNILGAVSGISLIISVDRGVATMMICFLAFLILWFGGNKWISRIMLMLVMLMGAAFFVLATSREYTWSDIAFKAITPRIPSGSEMLVLGLIGTTIVPYNIFIGSGISRGQTVQLMRVGLIVSVCLGGLITACIVFAGSTINEFTSFSSLAALFQTKVGVFGMWALALGLFAAGFSSSITSPFASSVIASTVFGIAKKSTIRIVWGFVLLTGFLFGVSEVKPIPIILTVQAINGLILPLIVLYLIVIVNDHSLIKRDYQHPLWYNIILLTVLIIVLLIGLSNIDKVISPLFGITSTHWGLVSTITVLIVCYALVRIVKDRLK